MADKLKDIRFGANHYGLTWDKASAAVIEHDARIRHPHFADNAYLYRGPDGLIWLKYPEADFDGVYFVSPYDRAVIDWYTLDEPGIPSFSAPRASTFEPTPVPSGEYVQPDW